MASERAHQAATLPRNFTFHYQDGEPPRTPEPEMQLEELQPPRPPRQVYRVRRRRTGFNYDEAAALEASMLAMDKPIPTIEIPETLACQHVGLPEPSPELNEGLLNPGAAFGRMISPPKTPEAQMMKRLDDFRAQTPIWTDMDHIRGTASRPTSSCSGISDSSVSSRGSFGSYPSYDGSCTSPEEDMDDPFSYFPTNHKEPCEESPLQSRQQPPAKIKIRTSWTEEMDRHLWMTYNKYLQDPTVTPFKVPPGKVPPNGVCHRVARMAKKTWKGPRSVSLSVTGSRYQSRVGTPDTIKPMKSGSSTPIASGIRRPYARFPSQAEARKRLRYLCKHQPSLSAHYHRLLHCKSPSQERSSPPPEETRPSRLHLSSPFSGEPAVFSTRDMNVSLATSTATSMQYGGPLSQLASDRTPRAPPQQREWSNMRSAAHQKSQSLHIGLGLGNMFGSAFAAMSQMTGQSIGQHAAQTWHAQGSHPRLDPPLELHSPRPLSRPFKRRALHNFEDHDDARGQNLIDQLFGAPAEISHRRVRSRGFSLGDVGEGARQLSAMFTPPSSTFTNQGTFERLSAALHAHDHESPAEQGQSTIRLGSPFGGRSSNANFNNTFPRLSAAHAFEPPASFEQRFAGLSSEPPHCE